MKTKKFWMLLLVLALLLAIAGCGQQQASSPATQKPQASQEGDLAAQLLTATYDFLAGELIEIMTASEIFEKIIMRPDPNYYIVDLRPQDIFLMGSIPGAVNIPFATTGLEEQIAKLPRDKKIVLVSQMGAEANQTAAFWGMLGFDVAVLSNGMDGWLNKAPESCDALDKPVTTEMTNLSGTYSLPAILGEGIVGDDLNQLLIARNQQIINQQAQVHMDAVEIFGLVEDGNTDYLLLDIRAAEHYAKGHIAGAVNIPKGDLMTIDSLQRLAPEKKIVVICYTGNSAHQGARLLSQLGYQATALNGGMSAWTSRVEIIGVQPTKCAWVKCYSDENYAQGFPVLPVECEWRNLPTVVTKLQAIEAGG